MRTAITSTLPDEAQLGAFVEYLLATREDERTALARRIHDELGGLLVSAAMDLGWAESHWSSPDLIARLRRVGLSLAGAIDMKRDIIEQLRPSLLDNFGLFEALRWHLKHACRRTEVQCTETYPAAEVPLTPRALSHLFRATETLLDCTFKEEALKSVDLAAAIGDQDLSIKVGHEHVGVETIEVMDRFRHELTATVLRLSAFQGELSFDRRETGLDFYLRVPLTALR
jgi:signal transduction histidine kinase